MHKTLLFHKEWCFELGEISAGEVLNLDRSLKRKHVNSLLTRRRFTPDNESDVSTVWDKSDFDVARIAEMMMFHQAAGGRKYTGLVHRQHGCLDLTKHLQDDQAILYGDRRQVRNIAPLVRVRAFGNKVEKMDVLKIHCTGHDGTES